jgi:tetratricopeptide (TPR) repeat protein
MTASAAESIPQTAAAPSIDGWPNRSDPRLTEATAATNRGDYQAAQHALIDMLRDHPESPHVLGRLALVATRSQDHASALQFADAALRITPDDASILAIRAGALNALGRLTESREAAELAVAYDPTSGHGYAALAMAWLREHTDDAYRHVLWCATRARSAMLDDGASNAGLRGAYAFALDALGAREQSDAIFADLAAREPANIQVGSLAADAAYRARRWLRVVDRGAAIASRMPRANRLTRPIEHLCAAAFGMLLVNAAGCGALLFGIGVFAQIVSPIGGAYAAVAVLAAYVATLIVCFVPVLRAGPRAAQLAARRAGPVAGLALVVAVLAAQVVSVIRVGALANGPGIWLSVLAGVAAMGALLEAIDHAVGWVRWRHRARHHRGYVMAVLAGEFGAQPPPATRAYAVPTSTPGALGLVGLPPAASPIRETVASATIALGFDLIVATFAGDRSGPGGRSGPGDPLRARRAEVIDLPVAPGRPPRSPEIETAVDAVVERLRDGATVAITCPSAAGASALVASAVCVRLGLDPASAMSHVASSRGIALAVTPAQSAWLDLFAARQPAAEIGSASA